METMGYAALQVIPSLKGVQATMDRELAATMPGVGQRAGRSFSDSFTRQARQAVQLTADITATAMTAAAGAGGAALVKGWDRLTTIQDAGAALEVSLGSAAEAGDLLGDTLDVVRGTPFNLDQFAAGAQQLAGMNVEAAKVPGYLEGIGEASATQGGRAAEFAERLIGVYGKVSSQGQLDLESVWQISETGVNALAILANSYGLTRDEMKDMISSGAVPAGEALDAITDGILNGSDGAAGATLALAGTMENLRNNMSGAVGGISPALARLGAAVIEPFSPAVVAGANSLVDIIDEIGVEAGELAQEVADSKGFEQFMDFLEDAPGSARDLVDQLAPALPVIAGITSGLGAMGAGSLPIIGQFLPAVNPALAAIIGLTMAVPEARAELVDLASDVQPVADEFLDRLVPVAEDLAEIAGDVLPPALRLTGDGLILVAEAGTPLLELVADLTGFLADHEEIVLAVGAAYGGWKIGQWAQGAEVAGVAMQGLAGNAGFLRDSIDQVAATQGVSRSTAAVEVLRSSISEVATTSVGVGTITTGVFAGIATGAALAFNEIREWREEGQAVAEAWLEANPFDGENLASSTRSLDELNRKIQETQALLDDSREDNRGWWDKVRYGLGPSLDRSGSEQLKSERAEYLAQFAEMVLLTEAATRSATEFGEANDLSADQVQRLAANAGVDLVDAFDKNGEAVPELTSQMATLVEQAEITGTGIDEAITIDPEILEANTKAVEEAMAATTASFGSFADVLQLTDDPLDPKAAADARQTVADAEQRLAEARQAAADLDSDATESQRREAMNRIADARQSLDDARVSLADLLATDSPLDSAKVSKFYGDVIAQTEEFSGNIRTAIEAGYDPQLIGRLLQAGPEQAGPLLEALVEDTSAAYVESINNAEQTLAEFTVFATRQAQLTQIAINEGTREAAQQLPLAQQIEQMALMNPTLTGNQIAEQLDISLEQAQAVVDTFGLDVKVYADPAQAALQIREFTNEERMAFIGVAAEQASLRRTEAAIATIARDRNATVRVVAITDPESQKLIDSLSLGSTMAAASGPYGEENQPRKGPPRAGGGAVVPGVLYPINERGLEGFVPNVPGTVINASDMAQLQRRPTFPREQFDDRPIVVNALGTTVSDVDRSIRWGSRG